MLDQFRMSERTVGRLGVYRRHLYHLATEGVNSVYSHQLALAAGVTAAQVRRDLMVVGSNGSSTRGYDVRSLLTRLEAFLSGPAHQNVALVGVGNLGRAILAYCTSRSGHLAILAAFDSDPDKVGRVIQGCRCHAMAEMPDVAAQGGIRTALLAVPAPEAQVVADQLVSAGIRGIVNFAPVHLRVPPFVHVENVDIMISLEKVAFFARSGIAGEEVLEEV